jgi:hypothetical protein
VPVALADAADLDNFNELYPLVARYVAERYREAGSIMVDGEPRYRVLVTSGRAPIRRDPELGLPCFA